MVVAAGDAIDSSGRYMLKGSGAKRPSQGDTAAARSSGEGVRERPQRAGPTAPALWQRERGGHERGLHISEIHGEGEGEKQ